MMHRKYCVLESSNLMDAGGGICDLFLSRNCLPSGGELSGGTFALFRVFSMGPGFAIEYVHTETFFRNLIKSIRNQIVFTISQ